MPAPETPADGEQPEQPDDPSAPAGEKVLPEPPRPPGGGGGPPGGLPPPAPARSRAWVTDPARGGLLLWLLRYYVFAALAVVFGTLVAGVVLYRHFATDLPDLDAIESYEDLAPGVTRIHASDGTLLAELAREHRAYARYEDIPPRLVQAFLAAEDRRFFEHGGLDVRGLVRASLANLREGTVSQGGSTISQQVAKGFLSQEQTLARKLREAILSVRMESRLGKERILEIYLNKIFLGHNAYGVGAAASRYFDKKLDELTLAESAMVAGLARAPSRDSPVVDVDRAMTRRATVLQDMVEAGYITPAERDVAIAETIHLAQSPDVFRARAPHYAEHVRKIVGEELGEDSVLQDGLTIETALELPLQAMAERAVDEGLRKIDRRQGFRGPVAHVPERVRAELTRRLRERYGEDPLAARVPCARRAVPAVEDAECPPGEECREHPRAREEPEPTPTEECPHRWRLALVTKVNKFNAWLTLGGGQVLMPLREMSWAARYDHNTGTNDQHIGDVRDALEEGDVVWVRKVDAPRRQSGNEDSDLPVVELGQTPRVEAALFSFDHQTGYVAAVQGGHDYDRSQFNRAIQGCRQPGSVFKAIYYALALDGDHYTMGTVLEDRAYQPEAGEEWNPQNIHGTLEGEVLLRNAFIFSLNLPSIRLFLKLGADNVVTWARRLGFTTELIADKALSLGASCVRMDELTRAFAIYVREGRWIDPVYVRRVVDKRGRLVLDARHPWDEAMDVAGRIDAIGRMATEAPEQVIDVNTAYLITKMMRDAVTSGIGRRATRIHVDAGGKSGTASKNKYTTDTWFVGFTTRYATAAWMGDDQYERSLGDDDASYTTATPMWTAFMTEVVNGIPHGELPVRRPPGIHPRVVEYMAGEGPRSVMLYFKDR